MSQETHITETPSSILRRSQFIAHPAQEVNLLWIFCRWLTYDYLFSYRIYYVDGNQDVRTLREQDGRPDLLVIVNYTTLRIKPDTIIDMKSSSVEIQIGMINDTDQVIRRTVPLSIPPGVNLLSSLTLDIRQLFKRPSLSAFGLFDVSSKVQIPRYL